MVCNLSLTGIKRISTDWDVDGPSGLQNKIVLLNALFASQGYSDVTSIARYFLNRRHRLREFRFQNIVAETLVKSKIKYSKCAVHCIDIYLLHPYMGQCRFVQ